MQVPAEKVSSKFECSDCGHTMQIPITDLPEVGTPICPECDSAVEMDMGMVTISEANSC